MKPATHALISGSPQAVALVLGLDSPTSLGVIRSLGKQGIPVIGVGRQQHTLGGSSRYCSLCETVSSDTELTNLLIALGNAAQCPPIIFTESDDYLLLLDRHRLELASLRWLPTSKHPLPELINKRSMLALAQRENLDIPATFFSDELPLETILASAVYPCFIKPLLTQNDYRTKGEVATTPDELIRIIHNPRFTDGYMAQEIIPGPATNLFFYISYFDATSTPRAAITGHKIRQIPPDFGIGTLAVSQQHPEITRLSESFLRGVGYHGLADLEFKYDPRDNRYKFIEINPRPCGLIELARAAGLNMALLAYKELTGSSPSPLLPPAQDGLVWMSTLDDLIRCMKYNQGRDSLWEWLRMIYQKDCDAVFSTQDLVPFLFNISSR
ncbi:MAG: ATP-grasp domain-containing protein, partial [Proteobacteria bacterium]|nr:hypothetical protein [Desulfobulbaceae bacterium]MBU4153092.1 ATP-grasp domain-containing protein [Pseudomonadota bacterium]